MTTPYTISPQDLLDAHAKTTQGTWETDGYLVDKFVNCDGEDIAEFDRFGGAPAEDEANARFCVLAHNGIVEIVERLERAEDVLIKVSEAIESMRWLTGSETHGEAFEQEIIELATQVKKARKQ